MTERDPTPEKLALVRRFLVLSGKQADLDRGAFLDHLAAPGAALAADLAAARPDILYGDFLTAPGDALRRAYQPYRDAWQTEYEQHVHWEFAEDELREIVAFFERPAGQHFLAARPRTEAYIATNTEHLVEQIVDEARRILGLPALPNENPAGLSTDGAP